MDLGTKRPDPAEPISSPEKKNKVSYPGLTLNDSAFEAFRKEHPEAKIGEEFTATVKFRVVGLREDEYGKSVSLDALSMDGIEGDESESSEGDEESKVLGYKRKKPAVTNTIPKASGKDLED